ncbi:RNA polymerase sigma factor [Salirhabdus salicampi]|uniref:RNA polymerase sigma factor n=1 Tax=Salirhabdus salicampi TaxID=476102 RepID=UPI0020C3EAD2|nr:RNA polymerase sigma factor [Salirhabdus salicampi]MCP8615503.1 RNA polymerase sigma factor [Salirhabdus salicampi]
MSSTDQEDRLLLQGISNGSINDFQTLYERYISYVYKIVNSLLSDEHEAADLCHDIFLEIYHRAHTYEIRRGSVKAWIAVKAKSRTIDYIRKKQRIVLKDKLHFQKKESLNSTEDSVIKQLDADRLLQAIKTLPSSQQEAIYYNYYHALSHREIADRIGRPLGTVKSLIRYGIQNIRKQLTSSSQSRHKEGEI